MLSSCLAWELSVSQLAELKVPTDSVHVRDSCVDECFIYLPLSPNSCSNCYYSDKRVLYDPLFLFFSDNYLSRTL